MEKERNRNNKTNAERFMHALKKAQNGDKKSMEVVLDYFSEDIKYLSRFIMLPKDEAIQELNMELISIVCENS